jgi:competence protein ComEC
MRWNVLPFLFITPALIIGILLNDCFKVPENLIIFGSLLLAALLLFYFLPRTAWRFYHQPASGILLIVCFIFLGYISAHLHWIKDKPEILSENLNRVECFTAIIDSKPDQTAKSYRYEVIIQKVKIDGAWQILNDKAILYNLDSNIFTYGDIVLIQGRPGFIEKQKNPHAFDYSLFLNRKGIYLQTFCSKENSILLKESMHSAIRYLPLRIGDVFEDILSQNISVSRELNMARAMVIGRRNEITPEMEYVYEATGTSHILAVSGLHVGIIFLVVSSLFKFSKRKGLKWLYYSVLLFSIWSFALITGFSPSVRRAALMLSFIIIAEMIRRKSNIYNTLFASAFCTLLFSPNLIFSVSFQFSYMAVLGIVSFYKMIYSLVYVKNRLLDFFWQITVLSISVQIATFAINIYYFHHFPSLFLLTNLFAIPTAIVVVVGSLAVFSTFFFPYIPDFAGLIVEKWVFAYNEIMVFFSQFEITSIENLSLKGIYVMLIILLVFILAGFIRIRRLYLFRLFTAILCLLALAVLYDNYQMARQQQLVVYSIDNQSYVDVFIGNTCFTNTLMYGDKDNQVVRYNIQPNRDFHLINELQSLGDLPSAYSDDGNRILVIGNTSIFFINEINRLSAKLNELELDVLVVGKQGIDWLDKNAGSFTYKNLVLDSSVKSWEIADIKAKLPTNVRIYSVEKDGAFILRI